MKGFLLPEDDGLLMRSSGQWAAIKLDYLSRYINIFETAMRKKWASRNFIDLQAGPGKNRARDSNLVFLGSPLLALTTEFAFTGYYFVDLEKEITDALDIRCKASPQYNSVNIFTGDCNVEVDNIVGQIRHNDWRSLNLAFLDPTGLELKWTTIEKLASLKRMDLIINYPSGGLHRAIPNALYSDSPASVDYFFGGQEWREIYTQSSNKRRARGKLIDFYKSRLIGLGYTEVFRGDEGIGDEPIIRNLKKNAELYRLIFASKHNLGHKFWREIIRRDVHGQARLPNF